MKIIVSFQMNGTTNTRGDKTKKTNYIEKWKHIVRANNLLKNVNINNLR